MINRTYLPTSAWINGAGAKGQARGEALAPGTPAVRSTFTLWQFVLVVVVACAVTCFYLWQLSSVATTKFNTQDLTGQAVRLERENAQLMLQVAALSSPARIEKQAKALGMVRTGKPTYVAVRPAQPRPAAVVQSEERTLQERVTGWWQQLLASVSEQMPAALTNRSEAPNVARP